MSTPDLRTRASFRYWTQIPLRYADLDPLGHVNNAGLPLFFEQARTDLFYPLMKTKGFEHRDIVLARIAIEYLKEIRYPNRMEVGTLITHLGSKSIGIAHGVFTEGSEVCVGTGDAVIVTFDLQTRTSIPIPPSVRQALEKLMA